MSYTYIDDIPGSVTHPRHSFRLYRAIVKRLLDVAIVVLILPIILPVILVAWAVMYIGGGKGFYSQPRIGKGGKLFKCWKIRTMETDADKCLATFIKTDPGLAREWHQNQKLQDDPRITIFGAFLRKTSIDELPQMWNVLIGDMSLIGPRPFTPDQKTLYDGGQFSRAYYILRPGVSGLWQVESRNFGEFTDRVIYDETYAENLSFYYDLRIAIRTVWVILRATGK